MPKNVLFTDGSDLEGVENVLDIKYVKLLRFTMRLIGLWPGKYADNSETPKYRFWQRYTFFIELICLLPGFLYLKNQIGKLTFFEGVENVLDIKYVKLLRFTMRLIGLWPGKYADNSETPKYRFWQRYTFFIELICLLPGFLYLKNQIGKLTFFEGVENVLDIKYVKLLRFTMRLIGLWPGKYADNSETPKYRFWQRYTLFLELICLLPGFLYLKNQIGKLTFFELGHTYITVFMNIVALSRIFVVFFTAYQKLGGDFINIMHLFHQRNKSEYAMKIHILVHKMSHFFTNYLTCMMVVGILLFNATPLYNNISSGALSSERPENVTFEHAVYYQIPFDYVNNFRGFLVVFCFNWYISVICSSLFCIFDLYLSLMVFHIFGHLRILIYNLENFPRPAKKVADLQTESYLNTEYFTKAEQETTFLRLRELIIHHRLITDFTSQVSNVFGPSLFIYYAFHQVSGCLLLLECSLMDPKALARYGPLTVILFQQLIQISIVFELIGSLSENLINAVYAVPWEFMDTRNRKLVYSLLRQSQIPIGLKAMGMVDVGVQTMAGIIKTSFSYFIMLRTVAEE